MHFNSQNTRDIEQILPYTQNLFEKRKHSFHVQVQIKNKGNYIRNQGKFKNY